MTGNLRLILGCRQTVVMEDRYSQETGDRAGPQLVVVAKRRFEVLLPITLPFEGVLWRGLGVGYGRRLPPRGRNRMEGSSRC